MLEHPSVRKDWDRIQKFFTPSKEEQINLILAGKCPHNQGWMFHAIGHNDKSYECKLCGDIKFY